MIVIAAHSAGRLAFSRLRRRETESDADVLHVFMGVAMAGMLVPWLSLLPAAARPAAGAAPRGPSTPPGPPGEDSKGRADLRGRPILAPRLAACCKIAMSIGMSYMLILML